MSSIYKHLSEELKFSEKEKGRIPSMEKPLQEPFPSPRFIGLKIIVGLAFLLSLAALAGAISFYPALNSEKRKREALEATQVQVQEKAASFEQTTEQYRSEITRMREQLKSYNAEREAFKKQIEKSGEQIRDLEHKLLEMEERNQMIEEQIAKTEAPSVPAVTEPPTSSVSSESPVEPPAPEPSKADLNPIPAKTAKVLTVNRRFNFIVVNLGQQDQIKIGDPLDIERNGKVIGSAKVEKLYESFAAAALVKEPKESPVKEGDVIRRPA